MICLICQQDKDICCDGKIEEAWCKDCCPNKEEHLQHGEYWPTEMITNKWVILWNNEPVGLDTNSGGYPFKTIYPSQICYWNKKEEAQRYLDTMTMNGISSSYINNYQIVEIQFKIVNRS